jgi:hypothetical protein
LCGINNQISKKNLKIPPVIFFIARKIKKAKIVIITDIIKIPKIPIFEGIV